MRGAETSSETFEARLRQARRAVAELRVTEAGPRNAALEEAARELLERQDEILAANRGDLGQASTLKLENRRAFLDRLALDPARLAGMAESLRQVAALPDPVGEIVEERVLANGLRTRRVRAPLGVILVIFESRPNVAVEAFSMGFKAGNAMILRGGRESMATTAVLYSILASALAGQGISPQCLWGITDPDRAVIETLLKQEKLIDVVVPRGGRGLIEFVMAGSRIPVIRNDRGLCHVYLHEDAEPAMARRIVLNAKTQRPGVCNAMETLLVHEKAAGGLLPDLHEALSAKGVEWFACPAARAILGERAGVSPATSSSFDTEYLDLKLSCRVVRSLDEAIRHIEEHGSGHSEAIVTRSEAVARRFQAEVDAAAVYWNASTRFTDGFELGLGGELGISTQKLHVRGPVGLRELTSPRWVVDGNGQTRG